MSAGAFHASTGRAVPARLLVWLLPRRAILGAAVSLPSIDASRPSRRRRPPEVVAKPKRHQFTAEYGLRILEETDRCT